MAEPILPIPPPDHMLVAMDEVTIDQIFNSDPPFSNKKCDLNVEDYDLFSLPPNEHISIAVSGYGVSEAMNAVFPDSGYGVSEAMNAVFPDSGANVTVGKSSLQKRRKETAGDDTTGDDRNQKVMRSENSNSKTDENNLKPSSFVGVGEKDEKQKARKIKNRENAHLSRQRKKHELEELEDTVRSMSSTIAKLNCNILFFMAENAKLRQQLNGNGNGNGMGNPPMAPMPYPWMPCVVKPQGSQVPLVPIPRLETASASKPKKPQPKKAEGKSKNP